MLNNDISTRIQGTEYKQFGKRALMLQMKFKTMKNFFIVDESVQRKIDPKKRGEIRAFIIESLEAGEPFYFSPFVFSARGFIRRVDDEWELTPNGKMAIIDGQHRQSSIASAINHLESRKEAVEEFGNLKEAEILTEYINQLNNFPISMQIYLDLGKKEERQLFSDLNSERRDAHIGQVMQYDNRDEYTELTRKIAGELEEVFEIETKLSRVTSNNSSVTSLATMRKCIIALFEGILTVKKGQPYFRCDPKEVPQIAKEFFLAWQILFPRAMGNREKYVSGLTGIQVALAYCVNRLKLKNECSYYEAIEQLKLLPCSWKHNDPLFDHLYQPLTKRIKRYSETKNIQKTAIKMLSKIEEAKK